MVRGNNPFPWSAIRDWVEDEFDPMIMVSILVVLLVAFALHARSDTRSDTRAEPIVIIVAPTITATAAPAHGGQGLARKLPAAPAPPSTIAPTLTPPTQPGEPSIEQPAAVFVALPAPTAEPQATPAAIPPPVATVPVTVYTWKSDGTLLSVYQCKPYGDWRDTDPMYVHPECAPRR